MKLIYLIFVLLAIVGCSEPANLVRPVASFSESSGTVNCKLYGYDSYVLDVWSISATGKATKVTEVAVTSDSMGEANITLSKSAGLVVTGDQTHDFRSEISFTTFQEHPFASVGDKSLSIGRLLWSAFTSAVIYKTSEDVPFSVDSLDEVKELSSKHDTSSVAITLKSFKS